MSRYTILGDEFSAVQCCTCGVRFLLPSVVEANAKKNSSACFYCPNGHILCYPRSEPLAKPPIEKQDPVKDLTVDNVFHLFTRKKSQKKYAHKLDPITDPQSAS